MCIKRHYQQGLPGGLVDYNSTLQVRGAGSIPGWGANTPTCHETQPREK